MMERSCSPRNRGGRLPSRMTQNRQLRLPVLLALMLLSWMRASGQMLYYATSSAAQGSNSVEHVTPAGAANWSIFTATGAGGNNVSRCTAIALDASLQKLFLVDAGNQELWSMNLDGTGLSLVRANLTNTPTDLALDTVNQKIYYTTSSATPANNTIQRMDYTGNNNTVLFTAGASGNNVSRCTALALDSLNSRIIFSDAGVKGLWSVDLSGSGLTLVASNLTAVPLDLALDVTNQLIYYTTSSWGQNSNTVQRVNYAGTVNTLLFTATGGIVNGGNGVSRCSAIEFDPVGSKLYLADAGANALWSLNPDGSGLSPVEAGLLPAPRRVRFISLAPSITVVNANDNGPGSLRQAILSSGASGLIDFSSTFFTGSSNTINLATAGDNTFGPSAILVTNQITIAGLTGNNGIVIARSNGAPAMRLFYVAPGGVLSLKNLTLTNGLAQGGIGGSGYQRGGSGGGAAEWEEQSSTGARWIWRIRPSPAIRLWAVREEDLQVAAAKAAAAGAAEWEEPEVLVALRRPAATEAVRRVGRAGRELPAVARAALVAAVAAGEAVRLPDRAAARVDKVDLPAAVAAAALTTPWGSAAEPEVLAVVAALAAEAAVRVEALRAELSASRASVAAVVVEMIIPETSAAPVVAGAASAVRFLIYSACLRSPIVLFPVTQPWVARAVLWSTVLAPMAWAWAVAYSTLMAISLFSTVPSPSIKPTRAEEASTIWVTEKGPVSFSVILFSLTPRPPPAITKP